MQIEPQQNIRQELLEAMTNGAVWLPAGTMAGTLADMFVAAAAARHADAFPDKEPRKSPGPLTGGVTGISALLSGIGEAIRHVGGTLISGRHARRLHP